MTAISVMENLSSVLQPLMSTGLTHSAVTLTTFTQENH